MTIGPSSRIMSLPWGVRTFSVQRDLILLSGAPTCLWRRLANFTNPNQRCTDSVRVTCSYCNENVSIRASIFLGYRSFEGANHFFMVCSFRFDDICKKIRVDSDC